MLRPLSVIIALVFGCALPAHADTALVAVASNFADAAEVIVRDFEADTSHRVKLAFGATGKLYAQIKAGAPYHAFLSADQARPALLERDGLAVAGTSFTYAVGRLTLWSADPQRITGDPAALLASPAIRAIAIANPDLAPYGLAARQTLEKLGLWEKLQPRIVTGENIGQTFALTATGNATLGFIASPLLYGKRGRVLTGSRWEVPVHLHDPIRQDAVLLAPGAGNRAARSFLAYLQSDPARAAIVALGYQARTE